MPPGVPIRIIAALSRSDVYRKPNSGMFDLVNALYKSKGLEIDMEKSIYVGDAAGRMSVGTRKKDHGDTDYKLALNVGLKFVTPEVSSSFTVIPVKCSERSFCGMLTCRSTSYTSLSRSSLVHQLGFIRLKSHLIVSHPKFSKLKTGQCLTSSLRTLRSLARR